MLHAHIFIYFFFLYITLTYIFIYNQFNASKVSALLIAEGNYLFKSKMNGIDFGLRFISLWSFRSFKILGSTFGQK